MEDFAAAVVAARAERSAENSRRRRRRSDDRRRRQRVRGKGEGKRRSADDEEIPNPSSSTDAWESWTGKKSTYYGRIGRQYQAGRLPRAGTHIIGEGGDFM